MKVEIALSKDLNGVYAADLGHPRPPLRNGDVVGFTHNGKDVVTCLVSDDPSGTCHKCVFEYKIPMDCGRSGLCGEYSFVDISDVLEDI